MTVSKISGGSVVHRGPEVARGVLDSSTEHEERPIFCQWGSTEIWSPVFYTAAPKCVCVRRLAGEGHLSPDVFLTLLSMIPRWALYRYVPWLVMCVPSLLTAGWRSHTDHAVPSGVKTRQHPLPLPSPGSKGTSLPYMANEIVVATLFMVSRKRLYQYLSLLLCGGCRWIPLMFASN